MDLCLVFQISGTHSYSGELSFFVCLRVKMPATVRWCWIVPPTNIGCCVHDASNLGGLPVVGEVVIICQLISRIRVRPLTSCPPCMLHFRDNVIFSIPSQMSLLPPLSPFAFNIPPLFFTLNLQQCVQWKMGILSAPRLHLLPLLLANQLVPPTILWPRILPGMDQVSTSPRSSVLP